MPLCRVAQPQIVKLVPLRLTAVAHVVSGRITQRCTAYLTGDTALDQPRIQSVHKSIAVEVTAFADIPNVVFVGIESVRIKNCSFLT